MIPLLLEIKLSRGEGWDPINRFNPDHDSPTRYTGYCKTLPKMLRWKTLCPSFFIKDMKPIIFRITIALTSQNKTFTFVKGKQ